MPSNTFPTQRDPTQLAGLDQSAYSANSFTYPLNLGAPGSGLNHYVLFNFNETDHTQYATASVNGQPPTGLANLPTVNRNAINDSQMGIASTRTQPISRVATTVALYMPPKIVTGYTYRWGETALGAAESLWGPETSASDIFKSFGISGLSKMADRASTISDMNVTGEIGYAARIAINNHKELLFEGENFRTFSFSFRFVPSNPGDALAIQNIIQAFKFYSTPEIVQGTAGRVWLYPAEVDVTFISNGSENLFINRISTCVVENITVDYTPLGEWAAHRAGDAYSPSVCTEFTVNLKEVELMTKQRILEYY